MNSLMQFWMTIRRSGWFTRGAPGALFPFPFTWQAWAITAAFIVAIPSTIVLPSEAAKMTRIGLCVGYIAFGMATYE